MAENPEGPTKLIGIEAVLDDDRRGATLSFRSEVSTMWSAYADTDGIQKLLGQLANARSQMFEQVSDYMPEGTFPLAAYNPRWYVYPDTENKFATFWIRHPGFGWSGYGFPRHEAANISKWLRKVTSIAKTQDTQSTSATSFGGDNFILTTEGLGFYYYGQGESRIGPNPFELI